MRLPAPSEPHRGRMIIASGGEEGLKFVLLGACGSEWVLVDSGDFKARSAG